MKIAITGSTGMIGSAVVGHLKTLGHSVTRIVRRDTNIQTDDPVVLWDISSKTMDFSGLEGHDAIIHLAGANIAQRWTPKYKELIFSSRVDGTSFLCAALSKLNNRPTVLISSSAVGFYGNHPSEKNIDESSFLGSDYLAQVCKNWEQATSPAKAVGIRVVHTRTGVVLSAKGGALAKMLPIFRLGLGGRLGSGRQMFSWIALDEIPLIIMHLINSTNIAGAVNLVSPRPVSNAEFTKVLGQVIQRPAFLPVPSLAIKLMFGEMGEALLLGGAKILPKRLEESGYPFRYPTLESALTACLT